VTLRFGTDGVRGVANTELTPELVTALGRAAVRVLHGNRFLIGRDTRQSGPLLEAALAAGMASEGADVDLLGMVPTPAVAWLSAADDRPAAMISASHNPFPDNGIKLFAQGGRKLTDAVEQELERVVDALLANPAGTATRPSGAEVGRLVHRHDQLDRYVDAVVSMVEPARFAGLRVVLDCAHGAATEAAPAVFQALGADAEVIHVSPDGTNINDRCGSTHPGILAAAVAQRGAHAGLAFDGDADRVIAVAGDGGIVDGDRIIAICALDRHQRGALVGGAVAVTVMSNLGFRRAMSAAGIDVVETQVGDRYVLDALEERQLTLGGEQSGHVIFRDLATTGDGILTAVQLLDAVVRSGRSLTELAAAAMVTYPQVLLNVKVPDRDPGLIEAIAPDVAIVEAELGDEGRVLVRPSGTEPLVRVMVEAETEAVARTHADAIADSVRDASR
jgi:phosphoglucosamine mutase